MLSRRNLLLGGTATAVVGVGVGIPVVRTLSAATPAPGPVTRGSFVSPARRGIQVEWSLIRPPDAIAGPHTVLPVVLALHGHGGSTAALLGDRWDLPGALALAAGNGVAPFAVATVSGGTGFWHPRPDGEDAGAMVTDEFLPLLESRADDLKIDPGRLGLLGWSMGGYGVLRLAPILGRRRVRAVCASSPGLYTDPALAHPDGFADPAEYVRYSVMEDQADLDGIPLRIDVGIDDPFAPAVRAYVDGFPDHADVTATFGPGGHEIAYSQRVLPDELAFLGARVGSQA